MSGMPDDLILLSGGPLDGQHVPRPDGRSLLVELSWTSMLARYRQTGDRDVYRFTEYDRRVPTSAPVTPKITDEMVERAAREEHAHSDHRMPAGELSSWDVLTSFQRDQFREQARRVLTAAFRQEAR